MAATEATKQMVKNRLKQMIERCDSGAYGDTDFLSLLGAFRNQIVYIDKLLTRDEFIEVSEEVVLED